ncbi:MAG: NAD(P)/FAD-dependent oxidoreductase [Candidatus Methanoplasma sp.]|jgi:thioredoxin reductase (NADPH)|nr:NAD(P)/FAD-dependent oxidoreductase [Candidatus Methanoplasma sp.]
MNADVVIIGCGPAGLQAGIHSSRKKAGTVILGKIRDSALYGAHVENYFGIPEKTNGPELLKNGLDMALSFGCRHMDKDVTAASKDGDGFRITIESGEEIICKAVVIATGISRMRLDIPGEKEFLGRGVSYCAECDCNFYKGLGVAVIGGGSKAAVAAELMTRYASAVYWVSDGISADGTLADKAAEAGAEIVAGKPKEIRGGGNVASLLLEGGREIDLDGVFIELGGRSSSDLAMDLDVMPETDDSIKVNERCETSAAGVFACGDVTGEPWQLAKAVGQGAVAGLNAAGRAKGMK